MGPLSNLPFTRRPYAGAMLSIPEPHSRPRAHWLNIAALLTDIAFETDVAGRFTAFGGTDVLGYAAPDLLGQNLGGRGRVIASTCGRRLQSGQLSWGGT